MRYLFNVAPFHQESVDVDELCPICCAVKISVRFIPCRHASCRLVSQLRLGLCICGLVKVLVYVIGNFNEIEKD